MKRIQKRDGRKKNWGNWILIVIFLISIFCFSWYSVNKKDQDYGWKTEEYVSETSFRFRYPNGVKRLKISETDRLDEGELGLFVIVNDRLPEDYSFGTWNETGFSPEQGKSDSASVEEGRFGEEVPFGYLGRIVNVNGINAKTFVRFFFFREENKCPELYAHRVAIIYQGGYQIQLTLIAPIGQIIRENPSYFTLDEKCSFSYGDGEMFEVWDFKDGGLDAFLSGLGSHTLSDFTMEWFDTFDKILSTFEFI